MDCHDRQAAKLGSPVGPAAGLVVTPLAPGPANEETSSQGVRIRLGPSIEA